MDGKSVAAWVRTRYLNREVVDVCPARFPTVCWMGEEYVVGDVCYLFVGVKSCDGYGINVFL